jgi:hypothetical protein
MRERFRVFLLWSAKFLPSRPPSFKSPLDLLSQPVKTKKNRTEPPLAA